MVSMRPLVLVGVLALGVSGCGGESDPAGSASGAAERTTTASATTSSPTSSSASSSSSAAPSSASSGSPSVGAAPRSLNAQDERVAQKQIDRIRPTLERLHARGAWDPKTVHAELLKLGYVDVNDPTRTAAARVRVEPVPADPGAREGGSAIGVSVPSTDACVIGSITPKRVRLDPSGPYPRAGCFFPSAG